MGEKTYELSGYESEMIKPKELIEIKEATETLLALYAPRHVHTKTVKYSEATQLKLGGLTCLRQPRYLFTLTLLFGERLLIRKYEGISCAAVALFCLPVDVS